MEIQEGIKAFNEKREIDYQALRLKMSNTGRRKST
jgi:hypothetical protein